MSQADMLASEQVRFVYLGECREGQIPRSSAALQAYFHFAVFQALRQ